MAQYGAPERMFKEVNQLVCYTFMQDNVAASQSAVAIPIAEVASAAANLVDFHGAPWAGDIIAIDYGLTAAGTAGVFTIAPTIGGTAQTALQATVGTTTTGKATVARGSVPVAASDKIGVKITTDGSWDGTSADLVVDVYVLYQVSTA